ncbi:ctd nuclear envelope phosphatase 1 [Anaeramoeba ignava]|uniref:Ctd nuclear envelope phosphatase 1 n=1 Tax=Anaeramoeba ignava TaxID=1746090 RepID=A0A9Q0R728_ANAIG|nr:ctd nuclear envelope phosphatase 1 [Anaeramoeba ignava]
MNFLFSVLKQLFQLIYIWFWEIFRLLFEDEFSDTIESESKTSNNNRVVNKLFHDNLWSPKARNYLLRRYSQKKLLILDLDETLVHSTPQPIDSHFQIKIKVFLDPKPCYLYVYKRPYLDIFLKHVCEWYDVAIFTASLNEYADPVIDFIDPEKKIKQRLFRDKCTPLNNTYTKNLNIFKRDLSSCIIIDNSPIAYSMNPQNAIPITTWMNYQDQKKDASLLVLLPFLEALRTVNDVRSILGFRLKNFN